MSAGYDLIVVGAGYAGLMAALTAQEAGRRTLVIATGNGGTHLRTGCIDVLGYIDGKRVDDPVRAAAQLASARPTHPYATTGVEALGVALLVFKQAMARAGYPFEGDGHTALLLPSALGAARPTALVPRTMAAGDLRRPEPIVVVGFDNFKDFYPALIAENLERGGHRARAIMLTAPGFEHEADLPPLTLARAFDRAPFRSALAAQLGPRLRSGERVAFPAVLGLTAALEALADLEKRLGAPVFEIPTLPPSIPGIRVFNAFDRLLRAAGARVQIGHPVIGFKTDGLRVTALTSQTAARDRDWACDAVVLATGGVASGGIVVDSHRVAREVVFGLPVVAAVAPPETVNGLSAPAAYFERPTPSLPGLAVDAALRPLDATGTAAYLNLYAAGALLTGAEPWREKSSEGISLASGWRAGQ
ncbi:MAG: glycerol-3-phosphate dehydrogenase subunit GlpB [Anaerolineales bacterium]|nr:glycerol-3-phosphate dehydrogenase subunit GlpB [Anaerolineales bacterium]